MKPNIEILEDRCVMARVMAIVNPEIKALLEDVDRLYTMPTEEMQTILESSGLPKKDFCYVVEYGAKDGNLWDGPIDANGNPQSENAMVYLFRSYGGFPDDFDPETEVENYPQRWYIGAMDWGCGANQQAWSEFAAAVGCELFQLTLNVDDGKFIVDQSTLDMLANAQLGDIFEVSVLTMGLEMNPLAYATEGQVFNEELGELIGDGILTLKLGIATEDGFQLYTLQSGLDEFNLHTSWTLTESVFNTTLDAYEIISRL